MLGVVVGAVSAISLLVFLQKDPKAIKQNKQQKQKRDKERLQMIKKAQEEQEKKMNDPAVIAKKVQRKNEIKEKMFKSLNEEERKLIEQYVNQKKQAGKTEQQIMKQAGAKAMLFCLLMVIVTIVCLIGIFIILNGDVDKVVATVQEAGQVGKRFLQWNFPRMAENGTTSSSNEL